MDNKSELYLALDKARYSLNEHQKKIIYLIASKVKENDIYFKTYKLELSEIIIHLDLEILNSSVRIEKLLKDLMQQAIEVKIPGRNKWLKYNWLIKAAYDGEDYSIQFHPDLKEYFLNLPIPLNYFFE